LKKKAEEVLKILKSYINKDATVIASGGIMSPDDALDRVRAGADLVQIYTGLIYAGPGLVKNISCRLETG
jgi:dihydroorotate dehydrogenase